MDAIDYQIMRELQLNAKISMKELASKVFLSSPAVIERVKKLEENGTIKGYQTLIDPEKLDKAITAIVLFETTKCKELYAFCENHPDVLECYRVAGQISYIAKVCTESVHTLEKFIDESMKYGSPSTNIVLSSQENMQIKLTDKLLNQG
ncbi:Lrp/AsnC family transcriptional regulator [Paenibacillus albiflavus]|uniref:Lrp/AsnC family transcriptional regulator n=1 Tax=Paenibacillus albiflavus TaxID=2545760 RepID=A0A4R4ENX3_9BACL|nr:Lrp/AsnC family transcriptional regulator [Paenibacillus albiflavus]TCZ80068.1 Lrp/AsnC family transcriptional regulator [Paenibacillus albiflavus]